MRRSLVPSVLAAVALATVAALAAPVAQARVREVAPAKDFRRQISGILRHTAVPVLLPDRVLIDVPRRHGIEVKWSANRGGWELSLGIGPRCGGANACFVGVLSAQRGGRPAFRRTLRLHDGAVGHWKPTTCGGSCSPPQIQWLRGRVLYDFQFSEAGPGSDRAKLVAMANAAIDAGPR
jgi:hypothetical protein